MKKSNAEYGRGGVREKDGGNDGQAGDTRNEAFVLHGGCDTQKKSAKPRSFSATAHRSKTEVDSNENIAAASGDNVSIRQKIEKSKG